MDKSSLETALSAWDFWREIFAMLVAIGIVGEVFCSWRYSARNRQLQSIQHIEDGKQQAAMGALQTEAEHARTNAESLKLDIAKANERASSAEEKAAKFNEIAERERLARIQLETRLAPRFIPPEKVAEAIARLTRFSGQRIDIIRVGDTAEVANFARIVEGILKAANWDIGGSWSTIGGVSGTGMGIGTSKDCDEKTESAAVELIMALAATGNECGRMPSFGIKDLPGALMGPIWDSSKSAPIRMFIGQKH